MACTTYRQLALQGFSRFTELLPNKPYCTDEKGVLRIRPKLSALRCRYIQPNPPALQHWLVFDLDYDCTALENVFPWEDKGLAEPNFLSYNPENGSPHIFYAIESVCTSPNAHPKPLEYMAAIQDAYTHALKADRCYTGLIAKNPLNPHWFSVELHTAVFSLGDLAKHVDLQPKRWTRKRALNDEHMALGRNCALFHRLRFWAYDHVNDYRNNGTTYNQWMKEVLARCEKFNDFIEPLPYGEVKSTAKSVGKWVWTKYTGSGSGKRRGAMSDQFKQSQIPMTLETKQRLSARRTHESRRTDTEAKIEAAIANLQEQGKKPTKAAVARLSGVGRQTIYDNFTHLFDK